MRALELDPNNVLAMDNLSNHEANFGRLDESLYWGRRTFSLSGRTGNDYYHVAVPLLALRADDIARRWLLDGDRRFPEYLRLPNMLAMLDVTQGRLDEAVARSRALTVKAPADEEVKFVRADVAFLTDSDDLQAATEAMMATSPSSYLSVPETIRMRYAYALRQAWRRLTRDAACRRGRTYRPREDSERGPEPVPSRRTGRGVDAARRSVSCARLAWTGVRRGFRDYGSLERDPILAPLRGDPKFQSILERIRKDVEAQRERARQRGLLEIESLLDPPK
jgi:hypothetical protein